MANTYSATGAREEFAKILNTVVFTGKPVIIERHGEVVAKIVPVQKKRSNVSASSLVRKYYGMWHGASWATTIGKPSRFFRSR